jgi:quercetin dioxygenase-like cupin family protein
LEVKIMKIIRAWEETGVQVPKPFEREIKLLLGPDKGDVEEVRINIVNVPSGGRTNYHEHDRPEMIFVIDGEGTCISEEGETALSADTLIWAETGDPHQIVNNTSTTLKLLTLFVPGFTTDKALYRTQMQEEEESD